MFKPIVPKHCYRSFFIYEARRTLHGTERFSMDVNDEVSERFTLAQAAKILGISVPTARRLIFSEKLRGFKAVSYTHLTLPTSDLV